MRRLLVCSAISTAMLGARAPGITAQDADVSPKGSPIAEPPNGTNLGVIFGITNLTTSSHRFFLQCARTGFVTGCSGPANISIPGNGYTQITVTFSTGASGTGTLVERVSDAAGEDSGSYVVSLAQAKVAVTPDSASLAVPDQTTGLTLGYLFTVANTGNTPGIINLTLPTCQLPATGCTLTRTSLSLGVDASDTVRVKFNTGAAGPGGQIRLRGTVGSLQDDGWVNVAAYVQAPLQATAIVGPGVERSLCVAISAGPGVASECGDLRIVHPLPRLTTRTRLRAPALLYNSQTAHPYVVIADTVGLRTTDQVPTTVQAALTLNGVLLPTQTWTGANWSPGATRRIAVGLDGITYSTGSYSYSLALQKLVNGTLVPIRTDTGHVLIANRSTSPFRPGWWLAGLDQLLAQPDGSKLFVGGDGSTRIYYPVAGRSDLWSAPQATRQDVIQKAGGYFVQLLPDGVKVLFDTVKLVHRRTVNRLGDTTYFTWSDSSCQHLNSITVPLGPSPTYQFHYSGAGCPSLTSVVQATGGLTRTTIVALEADGVTLRVTDPDSTYVRYAYSSAAGHQNQILTRYNRLNDTTAYVYDVAYQLSQVIAKMRGATALTTRFVNLATKGLNGATAIDTGMAYTMVDGPRTDVGDSTRFWLDRFGAPRKILDALGDSTILWRTDARWPALVTRLRAATGRIVAGAYDTHGNLLSETDSATHRTSFGVTTYATTQYQWDPEWNLPTQIMLPEGNYTQMAYDLATGNLVWTQDGRGPASRTTFQYFTSGAGGGLLQAVRLANGATTSFMYGAGGNVASARNPLGYYTYYTPDVLGRDSVVRTQIDAAGTAYEQDSTLYNLKDEAIRGVRYGPALPGAVAQRAIVQMFYDKEGRDTAVARSSVPDSAGIGTTSTWTHFDALGRVVAAIAGDHRKDSVVFDAAGNDTLAVTRRGKTIRKHFDALNRLTWRATDSVRYAGLHKGIATLQFQYAPGRDSTFPRYPNDGRGYTIAGDTATFTYNALGELLSANNSAAHVTRTYYLNGLDSTETEAVNTYHGSNFTAHVYTLKSFYDLNGRRTVLKYPDQLVGAADSAIWMYDGVTGNLATVFDLLHNAYMFQYDSLDQVHAVFAPGEIREFIHYLSDGALAADSVLNYSSSPHKYPVAVLRSTTFTYDARGKRLSAVNTSGPRPHRGMAYSGLGYLVLSVDTSYDRFYDSFAQQWGLTEAMGYDALGNQTHDTKTSSNIPWPGKTNFNQATVQDMYTSDGAARLARTVTNGNDDSLTYDPAGNLAFQYSTFWGGSYGHDRAAYYDAENRLRAVDDRTVQTDGHQLNGYASYTFDDYRYDALGRRVLTRSRRFCNMTQSFTNRWPCVTSLIRRTVWDGNTEAAEVQMPGGDSGTTAPAMPDVVLEQDTGYAPLLAEDATAYCCYDPNPFYGRVAYTYGLALDEPVSVARYGYLEGQVPNSPPDTTHHFQPFTVSPQWDSRGAVDVGTFADGGITTCETTGSTIRCVSDILWPYGLSSYNQGLWGHVNWLGTLLEGKQDGTGLLYRRHRYVDPATGRFTQEDPIGLAGGLNAYGFAQGDPVSYADPFGLCPTPDGGDDGKPCPGPLGQIINQVNQRMDDAMAQLADLAVKFLDIFTPAGDITRASTGIDPESGKRLSTGARVASGVAAIACVAPQGDESKAVEVVFKSAHGARHLVGTGLEAAEVESAISTRILEDVAGASETGTFSGRLEVGGNLLEFRAFTVSPGEINVGTYFPNP